MARNGDLWIVKLWVRSIVKGLEELLQSADQEQLSIFQSEEDTKVLEELMSLQQELKKATLLIDEYLKIKGGKNE